MVQIHISVEEYEGLGDKRHRTGRRCNKWFEAPTVPRVGEHVFLMENGAAGGEVKMVYHFLASKTPHVGINVDSNYPIQPLIEDGWERTGTKSYYHKDRVPAESLKYNKESPIPLEESVDIMPMPNRVCRILKEAGIETVGKLIEMTEGDIYKTPFLKRRSVRQIINALSAVGRSLKQTEV